MTARLPSLALRTARRPEGGPRLAGTCPGPGAQARLPGRHRLRPVPRAGQVRHLRRAAGDRRLARDARLPVVRGAGGGLDLRPLRGGRLRALVTGAARTAEELGRAFPGVPVRTSGGQHVLAAVPAEPALVIATPGAEPVAEEGYAAALLLDGWALLGLPSLRAAEEALRRWLNAAALVRPAGPVVVLAEATLPAVQALIRWDPVTFSERELAERAELGFPPAVRMASVTGTPEAVAEFVGAAGLPAQAEVLGPVPGGGRGDGPPRSGGDTGGRPRRTGESRALIRIGRRDGLALARALHAAQATRSARKDGGAVRVQLDPAEVA